MKWEDLTICFWFGFVLEIPFFQTAFTSVTHDSASQLSVHGIVLCCYMGQFCLVSSSLYLTHNTFSMQYKFHIALWGPLYCTLTVYYVATLDSRSIRGNARYGPLPVFLKRQLPIKSIVGYAALSLSGCQFSSQPS